MMNNVQQLHMRRENLDSLPPIYLREGFGIHTHFAGNEKVWEDIIERSFGSFFSFEKFLIPCGGYAPEYVLYVSKDGTDVATAMGTEKPTFAGEGWLRMVGAVPEARGTGAGRLAVLAAMHSLAARGYKSMVLSTDDFRLPAISVYLSLGFKPIIFDSDHADRWNAVAAQIAAYKKHKGGANQSR